MMQVVFISGPYRAASAGGIVDNIRRAEAVALKYWRNGYAVICPHKNTALFDGKAPDAVWLSGDLELLRRSDIVVMMRGWKLSDGAKAEHKEAIEQGKTIVYE